MIKRYGGKLSFATTLFAWMVWVLLLENVLFGIRDKKVWVSVFTCYRQTAPTDTSLQVLNFFKPNQYHMLARTPEAAARFNKALAEVKQSALFASLQMQYFAELNQL